MNYTEHKNTNLSSTIEDFRRRHGEGAVESCCDGGRMSGRKPEQEFPLTAEQKAESDRIGKIEVEFFNNHTNDSYYPYEIATSQPNADGCVAGPNLQAEIEAAMRKADSLPVLQDPNGLVAYDYSGQYTTGHYPSDPLNMQVGGAHYRDLPVQPIVYCQRNGLGPCESNVIKYVTRHRSKGGVADLRKAIHYLELLIQLEYGDSHTGSSKK